MMDANDDELLISLRNIPNPHHKNDALENGHDITRHTSKCHSNAAKLSLQWLDLKLFYVRVSKCVVNDNSTTPEYLTLNHVPLTRHTLLEVNCVRTALHCDGVSTLLKRDRLDKRSEEITFVSTDSVRTTGNVKFEVLNKDTLVLSGTLEPQGPRWSMKCGTDINPGTNFIKKSQSQCTASGFDYVNVLPAIEVYVAGSFSGSPIVLTKTLQLSYNKKKQMGKGMLDSIPEYEATLSRRDGSSILIMPSTHYSEYRQEDEVGYYHSSPYLGVEYLDGEDGELSWFNAGVRVGVGIGLGLCLGVGIGVGLLVRTYQGTTRNFGRRLL